MALVDNVLRDERLLRVVCTHTDADRYSEILIYVYLSIYTPRLTGAESELRKPNKRAIHTDIHTQTYTHTHTHTDTRHTYTYTDTDTETQTGR